MKLTLALEYPSLKSLAFVVNEANVSEYTVYPQIIEELQRRRKIRAKDILYFDKGYYSYENYVIGIAKYKIVPVIFQKINCNFNKLFDMLSYSLNIFNSKRNTKEDAILHFKQTRCYPFSFLNIPIVRSIHFLRYSTSFHVFRGYNT